MCSAKISFTCKVSTITYLSNDNFKKGSRKYIQLNYNYEGSIFLPVGFEVTPSLSLFNDLRISKYSNILPCASYPLESKELL